MSKARTIAELLPHLRASVDQVTLQLARVETGRPNRCFLVAGTERDVGTTVLTAATAMKIALYDREPVLHVETDVRRPRLSAYLGIPPGPGFSEALRGEATVEECVQVFPDIPTMRVLPGGEAREPVAGELAMDKGRAALEAIRAYEGYVFLDAAPITESPETRTLVEAADGIILVTRARSTRKSFAQKTVKAYEATGTPVLGIVLNRYKPERIFGF